MVEIIDLTEQENLEQAYLEKAQNELKKAGLHLIGNYIYVPQKKWWHIFHNSVGEAQFNQWAIGRFTMDVFDRKNIDKYKKILEKSKFDWRIEVC